MPFHVVATALAESDTDQNENRYVTPSFQGKKFPNEIAGYFSAVGYVFRQREKEGEEEVLKHRVLLSGPSTYLTKNVAPLNPVEEPDVGDWIRRIGEHSGGDTSGSQKTAAPTKNTSTKRGRSRATSK